MKRLMNSLVACVALTAAPAATLLLAGCDTKEDVLEIETPDGEIDIDRDTDSGDVDVDVRD